MRRLAGDIVGEQAATLGHHADIAEDERLDLAVDFGNLGDGQNAWKDNPLDPEGTAIELDCLRRGCHCLDGEMDTLIGMGPRQVSGDAEVGDDYRGHTGQYRIGACIDGRAQAGGRAGRTDQLRFFVAVIRSLAENYGPD